MNIKEKIYYQSSRQRRAIVRFLYFTVLLFVSVSCIKEVEIQLDDYDAVPVVNCFFTNDSVFSIMVSKTVSPLGGKPPQVENAVVYIYENGVLAGSALFSDSVYLSQIQPIPGNTYKIQVTIPDMGENGMVLATDFLPLPPVKTSFTFRDSALVDQMGYPISQAEITIEDNIPGTHYYEVMLEMVYKRSSQDTVYERTVADYCKENYDPVITSEGLVEFNPLTLVFSNKLFEGQTYSLKVNFQNRRYLDDSYPHYHEFKLILHLRRVSENYYKFKRQLIIHQNSIPTDFWQHISEPVNLFSNIQGGFGIFAGYSGLTDTIVKFY